MPALPWLPLSLAAPAASLGLHRRWALALLALGYTLAFTTHLLTAPAALSLAALLALAYAVTQPHSTALRYSGHALFTVLAIALSLHLLPGFHNPQVIGPVRYTPDALPFTLYLNLDKPLVGCWLLLVLPAITATRSLARTLSVGVLATFAASLLCLPLAYTLGLVSLAPKWPAQAGLWLANNLLLVTLTEEAFFRGYLQRGLTARLAHFRHGDWLALALASALFGLAHLAGGWPWVLMASLAGLVYGLAYRHGGLWAAILAHVGLNLAHFTLFTYPMRQLPL